MYWIQQIYESGDENAIAYLDYINSLEEEDQAYRPASNNSSSLRKLNSRIFVFPNPSSGIFHIKTTELNYSIAVYDVVGKLVYKKEGLTGNSEFNLAGYTKGFYLLNISSDSGAIIKSVKLTLE